MSKITVGTMIAYERSQKKIYDAIRVMAIHCDVPSIEVEFACCPSGFQSEERCAASKRDLIDVLWKIERETGSGIFAYFHPGSKEKGQEKDCSVSITVTERIGVEQVIERQDRAIRLDSAREQFAKETHRNP